MVRMFRAQHDGDDMTIAETLLPEFDQEMATTRRVLSAFPPTRGNGSLTRSRSRSAIWRSSSPGCRAGLRTRCVRRSSICQNIRVTIVAQARREGDLLSAARGSRQATHQPSGPPPWAAHRVSAIGGCSRSVDLRPDRRRADARVLITLAQAMARRARRIRNSGIEMQ